MKNKFLNIIGIIAVCVALVLAYVFTKEKIMNVGIKMENMDLTVNPGKDFYDFATLGWRKNNPIPNDYTRWTSFAQLDEINQKRVREIVEQDDGKIGLLYKIAMNSNLLNAQKIEPVKKYLDEIDNLKNKEDLPEYLGKMHSFATAFWGDGVALDEMDSAHYLYNIGQLY